MTEEVLALLGTHGRNHEGYDSRQIIHLKFDIVGTTSTTNITQQLHHQPIIL